MALIGLLVLLPLAFAPQEAAAHVSVHEPLVETQILYESDQEAHCHGGIECLVTLYPAVLETVLPQKNPPIVYVAMLKLTLDGVGPQHDPPVPIIL